MNNHLGPSRSASRLAPLASPSSGHTDPAVPSDMTTSKHRAGVALARVVLALIVLFNAAWISAFWLVNRDLGMPRTQADLMRHVTRIESLLDTPDLTTPETLDALQQELQAATADLQHLDSLLPLGGAWPFGTVNTEHHLLNLAMDTTQTAQNLISVVPVLQPQLARVVQSLMQPGDGTGTEASGDPLTIQTIHLGQHYLFNARNSWQSAQQERRYLTASSVAALNNAEASRFLAQYDALAPRLSTGLELVSSLLDWTPSALGVTAPNHFLLLMVDPSDLRPGGGRVWDYADLATQDGALVSGIHLQSVQSLDCPHGTCTARPLPKAYSWFPLNSDRFGLADANLDPDLPSAAATIETIYQLEAGHRVNGVIVLTPAVFASVLRITGPLPLPGAGVVATATNVEALLTAEHEAVPATGTAVRRPTPDLEELLTQAILTKLAAAGPEVQGKLGAALYAATQTKDLSFFGNSSRVEAMLTQLGMAGSIGTSNVDSLLVIDTNDGPTAVNPLVQERIADQITLDAGGRAQHQLTITYTYNATAPWSGTSPLQPYHDLIQVMVPEKASTPQITGLCEPESVAESARTVAACQLVLALGASTAIRVTWSVPDAVSSASARYSLLVQRQAGAKTAVSTSIAAPAGSIISDPGASSGAAPHVNGSALTWAASPLTQDTLLSASLLASGTSSGG